MSGLNSLSGKPLKHYAQDTITRQRYVLIALQNDTDPDTCSVVDIDALDADTRAELLNLVNSDECQRQPEIWKILDKKYFMSYPKATMLNVLQRMKQIKVVKSNQVAVQIVGDQTMTPKQIVDSINEYKSKTTTQGVSKFSMNEQAVVDVENKNATEIAEVKNEIASINTQIGALTSSIADLIKALKSEPKE